MISFQEFICLQNNCMSRECSILNLLSYKKTKDIAKNQPLELTLKLFCLLMDMDNKLDYS